MRRRNISFFLLLAGSACMPLLCSGQSRKENSYLEVDPLTELIESAYKGSLFETILPTDSGITMNNKYSHPEAWSKYWHQYYNGSIGVGISIGDVNGDSLPDIFLASKDSGNKLYLNNGDFTFKDITATAGVAGKKGFGSGTSFVDIDNDGDLDLYVGYIGSSNELFINDGLGNFTEQSKSWGLDIDTGTNAPSFADMDNDGDMDLYLQCNFLERSNQPEGLEDFLFENKGTHFVDITDKAGINGRGQGHAAIWWDFNEDGWPDIYIANDFEPTDKLYLNNRDNTFTDVIKDVFISSPYFGMGADLGDINNDGHIDFLVVDMAATTHEKFHTTTGTMGTYLLNISKTKISQYMKNMLTMKIGSNQFSEIAYLTGLNATGWTWAPRLIDMDNDGLLDAYFTTGMVREFHNSDLVSRMARASSTKQRIRFHENSPPLIEKNISYQNLGDLSFKSTSKEWGLDMAGISFAAAFADFDQDGDLDLIINNLNAQPTLYKNHSQTGNRVMLRLLGTSSNSYGIGAKVTATSNGVIQTRELSLTRGYMAQDEPLVHFSFLEEETIDTLLVEWPSGIKQQFLDLPTGNHYRIRETDHSIILEPEVELSPALFAKSSIKMPEEMNSFEEYYDLYVKQPLVPFDETWDGPQLVLGDLDNDGWLDFVMGGATGQETRVFHNNKGRAFEFIESDVFYDDYDSEDSNLILFDYDGDNDLDLLVTGGSIELDEGNEGYQDRLYIQGKNLQFDRLSQEKFNTPSMASRGVVSMDVNGDGQLDILIGAGTKKDRYPETGKNQVWLKSGETYIRDTVSDFSKAFGSSGKISELLHVDIDGDGDQDLVQTIEWGAPVIWINEEGTLSRLKNPFPESRLKGIWRTVAAGDFDSDGRIDLVIGNLGMNTKYAPTSDSPVALFTKKQNGYSAHIEAYTLNGRLVPVETRNLLKKQFPEDIRKTTRNYKQFSEKSIEEIFPNIADEFERREFTESRSMILYQETAGKFTPVPLPRWAQTGVVNDLLVADFNDDGLDDIVMSLEPLPTRPWAGRRQKGHLLLLLNNGEGKFDSLLPWQSGLEVNGYPKHLAWGDLDGDGFNELLVSQNSGPLMIFKQN